MQRQQAANSPLGGLQKVADGDGLFVEINAVVDPVDFTQQSAVKAIVYGGIVAAHTDNVCGWTGTVRVGEDRGAGRWHVINSESEIRVSINCRNIIEPTSSCRVERVCK